MANDTQAIIEESRRNLDRAIEFLKFAEAKNGAAIAFASALVLTTLQIKDGLSQLSLHELIGCIFALAAALVCARSFIPVMSWSKNNDGKATKKNILFFGDIGSMSSEEYSRALAQSLSGSANTLPQEYAVQVVTVSRIARDKMNNFSLGAILLAIGMFFLSYSIFAELFNRLS